MEKLKSMKRAELIDYIGKLEEDYAQLKLGYEALESRNAMNVRTLNREARALSVAQNKNKRLLTAVRVQIESLAEYDQVRIEMQDQIEMFKNHISILEGKRS